MLKSYRSATRRSERRRAVQRLRIFSGFAVARILCALVMSPPLEWASAHAQQFAAAKKRVVRKGAAPKAAPKEQQERATFTAQDEDAAVIPGIPDARIWGDSEKEFARLLPQASGPWLAISGGGSDGAYGAGVLTGWSESGLRPEFAVVTGVSIGALIAPFAFLGPRYDEVVHKNFTTIGAADIFEDRTTRDSLFDYWPLKRVIEQRVTPALLSEIAAEHARGRRLFVATTNLDAGRRVVWNMGALAAQHVAAAARPALHHRQFQARTRVQNAGSQHSRHPRSLHRRGADGGAARGSHVGLYRRAAPRHHAAHRPRRPELRPSEPRAVRRPIHAGAL